MSEVKRFSAGDVFEGAEVVYADDFDRVTAELASANSDKEAYAQNAIDLRKRVDALQALLTAAYERADVLEGLVRLLAELPGVRTSGMWELVVAALKPAEGGGDE